MKKTHILAVLALLAGSVCMAKEDVSLEEVVVKTARRVDETLASRNIAVDPGQIGKAVESAMFKAVDAAAAVLTHEEAEKFKFQLDGYFYGVGFKVAVDEGNFEILEVIEGGPADNAGVRKGDVILAIDGHDISGEKVEDAFALLKGDKGNIVDLTIAPKTDVSKSRTVEIALDLVRAPVISLSESWPRDICYMKIDGLYAGAGAEIVEAMKAWVDGVFFGMILDIRGANGLDLESVATMSGMFTKEGSHLFDVVDGHGKVVREYHAGNEPRISMPLVALVDGKTCSAAEVLAGVLKSSRGAMLLGAPTLGDNKIREFIPYNDKSLYIAVNHIRLASDYKYDKQGVIPDIIVENGSGHAEYTEAERGRILFGGITEDEKLDLRFARKLGEDYVLKRAADILLGLRALDISAQ